ncbi:MAG: phosphate acyltransferase PlsX [Bacillota bacterium]
MVRIAIDAMGGDYAPGEIIRGAVAALSARDDLQLSLIGRQEMIREFLNELSYPADRITVLHAEEVIQGNDDPGLAIRSKKSSSMVTALQMVRTGQADAVLSAGNTGALMAGGLLFLGRLGGISRPALLAVMPSFRGKPVVILDVGANMDARPEQLLQYAFMGRIYAQQLLAVKEPRTALLNVGIESNKGNHQVRKAFALFQEYMPGFCGNIEGTDFFFSGADVVVCDGFVGNITLKVSEGLSRGILGYLKQEFTASLRSRLGALMLKPGLYRLREKIDDTEYGGAPLVGVKGLCIKCHGSSKARTIEQAILRQAYPFVKHNVLALFQEALQGMVDSEKGADSSDG